MNREMVAVAPDVTKFPDDYKQCLYVIGLLSEAKTLGAITGGTCRVLPKGREAYAALRFDGLRLTEPEIQRWLPLAGCEPELVEEIANILMGVQSGAFQEWLRNRGDQ